MNDAHDHDHDHDHDERSAEPTVPASDEERGDTQRTHEPEPVSYGRLLYEARQRGVSFKRLRTQNPHMAPDVVVKTWAYHRWPHDLFIDEPSAPNA